jgi:hypothetical protein
MFDDVSEDLGWDAVREAQADRDAEGWAAEFRIPYSQLRFRDAPEQTWGIQFFPPHRPAPGALGVGAERAQRVGDRVAHG